MNMLTNRKSYRQGDTPPLPFHSGFLDELKRMEEKLLVKDRSWKRSLSWSHIRDLTPINLYRK